MKRRPTYEELADALSDLIDAYSTIDDMLDAFASSGPEGMTRDEKKRQRQADNVHAKAIRIHREVR